MKPTGNPTKKTARKAKIILWLARITGKYLSRDHRKVTSRFVSVWAEFHVE